MFMEISQTEYSYQVQFEHWKDKMKKEVEDCFPNYDKDVIKAIMFAALYEEQYALNIVYKCNLDDSHISVYNDCDDAEDHYLEYIQPEVE